MAEDRTPRYVTLTERADETKRTSVDAIRKKRSRRRAHPTVAALAAEKEKISRDSQHPPYL